MDERERTAQVGERFTIGETARGMLGRLPQIMHGPYPVLPPFEVQRQLGDHGRWRRVVQAFQAFADTAMQPEEPATSQPLVEHLDVERMAEGIAANHRTVGTFL